VTLILHERVFDLLRAGGFSGWQPYPCEVIDKAGIRLGGYSGLAVRGRCGPIDNSRSIEFDKIMPGGTFKWWRGLFFDPATWDGSDFFMPTEGRSGLIFVTEPVKKALERVKHIVLSRLDLVERVMI
jgi:hypothetical protein